eukprot:4355807-Pleurochrysis_carterae.AAC.1
MGLGNDGASPEMLKTKTGEKGQLRGDRRRPPAQSSRWASPARGRWTWRGACPPGRRACSAGSCEAAG